MTVTTAEYLLDTGTDLGREQIECLEVLLDHHSTHTLTEIGVRPGQRVLELGAGGGSITRWLADRVRPSGQVTAVDLDVSRLTDGPNLTILDHDIDDGVPGGPYDLIHARLVLLHLRRRREVLAELVDALAPGGWLVLGEYLGPVYQPLSAPSPADAELFARLVEVIIDRVGRPGGISYEWAHEVDGALVRAGLTNVHTERHIETFTGGSTGAILFANYFRQAAALLRDVGVTDHELEAFLALMRDPRLRAWLFEFTSVRAQKPA